MTTVGDRACFGVYADREALPDVGTLARDIDAEIGELLARTETKPTTGRGGDARRGARHRDPPGVGNVHADATCSSQAAPAWWEEETRGGDANSS